MPADRRSIFLLAALFGLAYLVMASYGLARPASESLFLAAYSSRALPWVWLSVAFAAVLAAGIFNRYALHVSMVRLFGVAIGVSVGLLFVLLGALHFRLYGVPFLLYVWKDVYIMLLVEIFWSFANLIFSVSSARWLYGLFLFGGSLGSTTGNLCAGVLAKHWGTELGLWIVIPVLLVAGVATLHIASTAGIGWVPRPPREKPTALLDNWRLLRRSSYLTLLLALIATVQIVITLVDYQFNTLLEVAVPQMDLRTNVIGRVYAAIEGFSILLQLASGPVLRILGVSTTLIAIPGVLAMALATFLAAPRFATMLVAKIASKSLDYSIFRAAKEILYIPLSYAEKTQGKALIDILTYRAAKAGGSALLLCLPLLSVQSPVTIIALGLVAAWIVLVTIIVGRYRRLQASPAPGTDGPS
jgi:AAA family ATP:ADP antiporter